MVSHAAIVITLLLKVQNDDLASDMTEFLETELFNPFEPRWLHFLSVDNKIDHHFFNACMATFSFSIIL